MVVVMLYQLCDVAGRAGGRLSKLNIGLIIAVIVLVGLLLLVGLIILVIVILILKAIPNHISMAIAKISADINARSTNRDAEERDQEEPCQAMLPEGGEGEGGEGEGGEGVRRSPDCASAPAPKKNNGFKVKTGNKYVTALVETIIFAENDLILSGLLMKKLEEKGIAITFGKARSTEASSKGRNQDERDGECPFESLRIKKTIPTERSTSPTKVSIEVIETK